LAQAAQAHQVQRQAHLVQILLFLALQLRQQEVVVAGVGTEVLEQMA
jgi:hypothetical protein